MKLLSGCMYAAAAGIFLTLAAVPRAGAAASADVSGRLRPPGAAPALRKLNDSERRALEMSIARHLRIRARFARTEQLELDRMTGLVRRRLLAGPFAADLPGQATAIVAQTVPGLSAPEAASLADYALGGIAADGIVPPVRDALGVAEPRDDASQIAAAMAALQQMQMSYNLQYLQLQSAMQDENRAYTALSNILKTKHDTVKNAISNMR